MRVERPTESLSRWVVGLGLASFVFTLPHSFEDFAYGIPAQFGLSVATAGFLLSLGYLVHVIGILMAAAESAWGYLINLIFGLGWTVAVLVDHLGEILYVSPYREGFISKGFEVGIAVVGLALAAVSAAALWRAWRG